jgi:hypothetical protein
MKTSILSAFFVLVLAATVWAADPVPAPAPVAAPANTDALSRDVQDLNDQLKNATDQIVALQDRLDAVEKRLGESFRSRSPFDTIESRLEDLEKDMDNLKRGR